MRQESMQGNHDVLYFGVSTLDKCKVCHVGFHYLFYDLGDRYINIFSNYTVLSFARRVIMGIAKRIYNIQDYNNNYDMKAARRRYLIYINDDEGFAVDCMCKVLLLQDQSRCRLGGRGPEVKIMCSEPCLCERTKTRGPHVQYPP